MPFITKKSLLTLGILAGVGVAAAAGFVWSGVYNVGADDPHSRPVYALMESLRERSIEVRASKLQVPDLSDPARIAQGAGNYDAMCTGCHLSPGVVETELSKGLYPTPPNLTRAGVDAAEAFWVIKHGVKASGMPAWGRSMEDTYIWNMVAFLQQLPSLDAQEYKDLVARSGGHSHGGGESGGHAHADVAADHDDANAHPHPDAPGDDHHAADNAAGAPKPMESAATTHVHADGKQHVHAPKATAEQKPAAESATTTHVHADGKQHVHAPKATTDTKPATTATPPAPAPEEHDHQH